MSYTIEIVRKPLYLHVKVTGENGLQTVTRYLADVLDSCTRHHCPNVLIEENLQGPRLNTLDVFTVVHSGVSNAAKLPLLIAYVDTNTLQGPGLMHFAESLAVGRGMNVRVFDSVPEAEDWLNTTLSADSGRISGGESS